MDRSILQCTIPSIQQFPAITNETWEDIITVYNNDDQGRFLHNCKFHELLDSDCFARVWPY